MGDYNEALSTSERDALIRAHKHEDQKVKIEDLYKGYAKSFANDIAFMEGRLIGLVGGNHYFPLSDGRTSDHIIASHLKTRFLGVCSAIHLSIRIKGRNSGRTSLTIWAHHGRGGGILAGSTFNTIEKFSQIAYGGDIFLMGHDHMKGCIQSKPKLKVVPSPTKDENIVREHSAWLGRTGSFLKAYEPGMAGYNVDACRPPAALGWIEFSITPVRRHDGGKDRIELDIRGTS